MRTGVSAEWQAARLGIPTASCFKRILTPAGKLSASRDAYMAELLAEYFLGEPIEDFDSEWVMRGKLLEPQARDYYAFHADAEPKQVGFCYLSRADLAVEAGDLAVVDAYDRDAAAEASEMAKRGFEAAVGASPDGLVGDDGALELKCPMAKNHLLYLARGIVPREYTLQVQGLLWVTGRSWCGLHVLLPRPAGGSFGDKGPIRVEPDPKDPGCAFGRAYRRSTRNSWPGANR